MQIAIIGATNGTGKIALQQALAQSLKIKALSPSADRLPAHLNLTAIAGSATHFDNLKDTLLDTEGALICLGTRQKKKTVLFSHMAKTLIKVAQAINYEKPILIVSGFGVGDSFYYANLFVKSVIRLFLKDQYHDKKVMEDLFVQSNLKWEIVQPSMLSDVAGTGNYKTYTTLHKGMKVSRISREDLASYLLHELQHQNHLLKKVVIGGT